MTTRADVGNVLAALLKRAPTAARACPLPSGRLAILQSTSALATGGGTHISTSGGIVTATRSTNSSPAIIPIAEWKAIRDDLILATLAATACAGKKDRQVLWDIFVAPELYAAFPSLLPGFRPRLPPSGILSGGDMDWVVLALFPVQKGALSLTIDSNNNNTAAAPSGRSTGGSSSSSSSIVYRSLGAVDARGVMINRMKKALYHGWTNRTRDPSLSPPKGGHHHKSSKWKSSSRHAQKQFTTSTSIDDATEWSALGDLCGLDAAAAENMRFQFSDVVADTSLIGYVEVALRHYKDDAHEHIKTIEQAEMDNIHKDKKAAADAAREEQENAQPDLTPGAVAAPQGGSRFRKKPQHQGAPAATAPAAAAPAAPASGGGRFKKTAAPLVAGVAPSHTTSSISAPDRPAHKPQGEVSSDRRLSWVDKVREGARSPFRKVQGGLNLGYYLQLTDDLDTLGGPHAWQAILPLAAKDGHLKNPVLLTSTQKAVTASSTLPSQQQRVLELLQDERPCSFQNAKRYDALSEAQKHIEHVYNHAQLNRLLRRIHRLKKHMPTGQLVPLYIDAEFGHTRFNKSISLLQMCYYSKSPSVADQLVQRVAIIDVHQLLNTESLAKRRFTLQKKKKRCAATALRHQQSNGADRPQWVPCVRWVRGRKAAYLLQRGIFGNPYILKVLHGSTTDLILLFRSLGCHLLAPLPPSSCPTPTTPLWTPTPFLDTGSLDMKLRFIIWDALTSMAQSGSTTQLDLPMCTSVTNNVGLANLMRRFNTGHLKSLFLTIQNWDRRPLQEELLQYAADDVRYLHEIFFGLLKGVAVAASAVEGDRSTFEGLVRPILQRVLNDISHYMSSSDGFDAETQIASTSTTTKGFRRSASESYSSPDAALVIDRSVPLSEVERNEAELERIPTPGTPRPAFRPYVLGPEATLLVADAVGKWLEEQRKLSTSTDDANIHNTGSHAATTYVLSELGTTTAPLHPNEVGVQSIPAAALLTILLNADNTLLFYAMPELRPTPEVIKAGKGPKEVHFPHSEASPQGRTLRSKHANLRKLIDRVQGSVIRGVSRKITDLVIEKQTLELTDGGGCGGSVGGTIGSLLQECGTITDPTLLAHGFKAATPLQLQEGNDATTVATYQLDTLRSPNKALPSSSSSSVQLLPSLLLDPITRPPSLLGTLVRWAGHVHRVSRYNITNIENSTQTSASQATAFKSHLNPPPPPKKEHPKQHRPPLGGTPAAPATLPSLASWGSAFAANDTPSSSSTKTSNSPKLAIGGGGDQGGGGSASPSEPTLDTLRSHVKQLAEQWRDVAPKPDMGTTPSWLSRLDAVEVFKKEFQIVERQEKDKRDAIREKYTPPTHDPVLQCLSDMKAVLRVHRNSLVSTARVVLGRKSDVVCRDVLKTFHSSSSTTASELATFIMGNHLARVYFNLILTVSVHSVLQCYSLLLQVPALPTTSLSMMNFKNEVYDPQADTYLSKTESMKLKRKQFAMTKIKDDDGSVGEGGDEVDGDGVVFAASPPFPAQVLSHQFEMVVIEVMKRLEENERILEVKMKRLGVDDELSRRSEGSAIRPQFSINNQLSPAAMMDRRFSTGDAKDVMRSFLGSPHNYQPTRKLIEGEIASFITKPSSTNVMITPPKWALQIVPLPLPNSASTSKYDVPLVTSRLYHATFASMLGAAVQRTYYATEYTLSLLVYFQMSVASVAKAITDSVLLPSPTATTVVVDPSGMEQLLVGIRDGILAGEGTIGAKQLNTTASLLDQYSPTRYGQDDAVCGAVRAALLDGVSGSPSSSSGGEGWTHEVIVAVLVADYVLAVEDRWLSTLSQSDDPTTAATAIPNIPKLRDFSTSLLQQVFVPLSNNYVSGQVIEGLSQTYTGSSSSSSEGGTQPLLSSLTMATLFAKFYHPLRSTASTTTASHSNNAAPLISSLPEPAEEVVDRVAQANANNTEKNQSDDIVVAQRKNYGVPLPCLITRDEFAVVAESLFQLKSQFKGNNSVVVRKRAISSLLRRAHLSEQASHMLSSPSPWVSAHEQHLVDLIHGLYF